MSAQPEGFLFNRSDKVGMDGDQRDGDHALYLDDRATASNSSAPKQFQKIVL